MTPDDLPIDEALESPRASAHRASHGPKVPHVPRPRDTLAERALFGPYSSVETPQACGHATPLPPVAAAFAERRRGVRSTTATRAATVSAAASAGPAPGFPMPGSIANSSASANSNDTGRASARVLHVIPSLDPRMGGVVEAVVQLVRHLEPLGCASEVVTLDADEGPVHDRVRASVHRVGPGRGFYGLSPRLVGWIRANRARFDAIVVHGIWQFHSVAAWAGVIGTRTPLFVFPHGMLDPWFERAYPAKHLKKRLYWALLERRVFDRAHRVLFTCEEERELARHPFLSARHRLAVNGFGIDSVPDDIDADAAIQAFRRTYPALDGTRIWLFLSRIHEKKGCDLLIDAFADVAPRDPSLRLVIAGPGDAALIASLKQQARARGVADRIVWPGMLSGELKWGALAAAEVFVLPSHQENFGIAVVEALASRTPVLITNRINIWREIEASGGGWICTDTRESVRDLLARWAFDTTPDQRELMREAAYASFETHFRIEAAARALLGHVRAAQPDKHAWRTAA
ncbi:glycosyltransferase [Pararobbsia silviterrae]|uniref:Glycosyltransferase n=1 Tax=Pararobbsia silviterrae TaxID=1792498 RepID=A0A494YAF1_9BURK|nr:glycosyltransferase [Pararobbsia silviterrae]RKP59135.1 glycosyltransferase [Pararobbsia silviterrae]